MRCKVLIALSLLILVTRCPAAEPPPDGEYRFAADRTINHELHAVPAPSPVTVDGRLEEWDLSGGILSCLNVNELLDRHAVWYHAMHDGQALYLAARVTDSTPLVNPYHPISEPLICHRGDTFFARFQYNEKVTNFFTYVWSEGSRPAIVLAHGLWHRDLDFGDAIAEGATAAFQMLPDSTGYVAEVRIPWELITGGEDVPDPGQRLSASLGTYWSGPSYRSIHEACHFDLSDPAGEPNKQWWYSTAWGHLHLSPEGDLDLPTPPWLQKVPVSRVDGPVEIAYELPEAGYVTLAIERPDGTRVRNLIADAHRQAGRNLDHWDGTDDAGRLVAPGSYRVRGLRRGELDVLYQFAYGAPGDPPWETLDRRGGWLSDHEPPLDVEADDERVYLSTGTSENGTTVIAVDAEGRRLWGIPHIWGGMLARHGDYLYMLSGGKHPGGHREGEIWLYRIDAENGIFASFPDGRIEVLVGTYPPDRPLARRPPTGEAVAAKAYDAAWVHREAMGLAATGDRLYVSLYYDDLVIALDPEDGSQVGAVAVDAPVGLAADPNGNLYAVSGTQVVRVDPGGAVTPVVTEGLEAPIGLATDAAGNLYVSDWGGAMDVKVFSPEGELLSTIGRAGGRSLSGPWDRTGMFRPFGIAVDARNRLWVAEHDFTPKRISVWDGEGTLLREMNGPPYYQGTECNVNHSDPDQGFVLGNVVELDWDLGRWQITGTLWRPTGPEALLGPLGEGMVLEVIEADGRDLLVASRHPAFLCISELGEHSARPLMALGATRQFIRREGGLPEMVARNLWDDAAMLAWAREAHPEVFSGHAAHMGRPWHAMMLEAERRGKPLRTEFIWTDADGDGLVQEGEVRFYTREEAGGVGLGSPWRFAYAPDLTLYPVATVDGETLAWRLPLRGWNEVGAPVYDVADAELVYRTKPEHFLNSAWADGRGNLLLNQTPLQMVSPTGDLLWEYPNGWPGVHASHRAPMDRPGILIGPLKVIGSAELGSGVGEVFCMNGNYGKAFLMTTDGLYVGSLFRDTRSAPEAMPATAKRGASIVRTSPGGEWFGGEFFRNPTDGKIYIGSARQSVLLSEVTGLETVRRLPTQSIEFAAEQYERAAQLLASRAAQEEEEATGAILRFDERVPLDGSDAWPWEKAFRWRFGPDRRAEAILGYDDDDLLVSFRVADRSPLVNGGQDWKRLFKTGDAVVVELGAGGRGDSRSPEWLPGDLRLVLTVFEGQQVAVLYRYVVPGTARPEGFTSPVGTTRIDRIEVVESARIEVSRTADGYTLSAAVPLAALGFQPRQGDVVRGDVGVIHSDRDGQRNQLRMYWSNKATGMVTDLFTESRIRPELWGELAVE